MQPGAAANGWNMIFHFAEHSPLAVHAARLGGIPAIVEFGPRHIRMFAGGIDEEVTNNERMFIASRIYVADAASGDRRPDTDLVFPRRPHLEAHEAIAHPEFA